MIQELLGGSNVSIIGGERSKISTPVCGGILDGSPSHSLPPSSSPSPSSSSTSVATTAAAAAAAAATENLRCPRCDSSNTKFCYYNNYNLTQPRHFCKTCRRYWTKGGALRNVPIGGGCRKNKNTTITTAVGKSSSAGKLKTVSQELGKSGLFSGFDHAEALTANPILWASSQTSHFLSLLRANQSPNPTHLPNSISVKEENALFGSSHLSQESSLSSGGLNPRVMGLDPLAPIHLPSMGLSNSLYRNQTQPAQGNIIHGEVQNNGLQELYQRLRSSSSTSCYPENAQVILGNVASAASSTASAILESAPVAAPGEFGFWNHTISWPTDLPTTNGAYP